MNWDDIKIFLAVSRRRKLSLAASELKLDETTVSRRLKRLEEDIGYTLFERLRSGHQLTVHGERLLAQAEQIESTTESISPGIGKPKNNPTGTLRISVSEGFGTYLLAPLFGKFVRQYPEINIELVSGSGFLSLSKREADVAIGLSRPKSTKIISEALTSYDLHLYAAKDYLASHATINALSDLSDYIFIDYIDDLLYADELRYFEDVMPDIRPQIRSTSILAQKKLVQSSAGLAILPDFLAEPDFVKILPETIHIRRQFWFSAHQTVLPLAKTKAFRRFAFEHLSGLKSTP